MNFSDPSGESTLMDMSAAVAVSGVLAATAYAVLTGDREGAGRLALLSVAPLAGVLVGETFLAWSAARALTGLVPVAAVLVPRTREVTEIVRRPSGTLEQISQEAQVLVPELQAAAAPITNAAVRVHQSAAQAPISATDWYMRSGGAQMNSILAMLQEVYVKNPQMATLQQFVSRIGQEQGGALVLCGLLAAQNMVGMVGPAGNDPLFSVSLGMSIETFLAGRGLRCSSVR